VDPTTTTGATTTSADAATEPLGVYTISTSGGEATYVTDGTAPAWSPSGDQIAFEGPDGIYTISTSGGEATYVATGTTPAWSPSGDQIAFEGQI
jgi:Tol biopolymer transport system component